jgi:hypothetical protein
MNSFDWNPWIPKIEEAVKKNAPLEIDLPPKIWMKLKHGGLASLKDLVSPEAFKRLLLMRGEAGNSDRHFLTVIHIGLCPGR